MKIRQAPIRINPVMEEPAQIAFGLRFDQVLKVGRVFVVRGVVLVQRTLESGIARQVSQHPPNQRRLAVVESLLRGFRQGLRLYTRLLGL